MFFRNSNEFVLHDVLKNFLPLQIKPCSELSFPVKIYFCVTILSLLSVIGLTIETLVRQTEEDFTISLIQLVGVGKKHSLDGVNSENKDNNNNNNNVIKQQLQFLI